MTTAPNSWHRICAEAGMEVVYTGLRQTPEMIVAAAEQEDADVVGLSSLSGVHNYFFPRVVELMKQKGLDDVLLVGGGIIPEEDYDFLKKSGMAAIFGPGTPTTEIVDFHPEQRSQTLGKKMKTRLSCRSCKVSLKRQTWMTRIPG